MDTPADYYINEAVAATGNNFEHDNDDYGDE